MLASTTRVHAPPASGLARSRGTASTARRPPRFGVGDARRVVHLPAVSTLAAGPARNAARASEPGRDEEAAEAAAREIALELAVIADETRAADVRVLGVSRKVHWARYFILATAFNRPQMQAVATKMRDHLNEKHGLSLAKNVTQQGDWVCVDCGEVVVHVFTPQSREFYDIEALYRDAVDVELPFETERPSEDGEDEVFDDEFEAPFAAGETAEPRGRGRTEGDDRPCTFLTIDISRHCIFDRSRGSMTAAFVTQPEVNARRRRNQSAKYSIANRNQRNASTGAWSPGPP